MKKRRPLILTLVLVSAFVCLSARAFRQARKLAELTAERARLESVREHLEDQLIQLRSHIPGSPELSPPPDFKPAPVPQPAQPAADVTPASPDATVELASRDREIAALRSQLSASTNRVDARDRRASFNARWEEARRQFQQSNPEEYERQETERKQRRQDAAATASDRAAFIKSISTEGLADAYKENHAAVVERMDFISQSMQKIAADPDSEASHELRHEMFSSYAGLGEMLVMEREILLTDLALSAGYENDDAKAFVQYVTYINDVTSIPGPFGRGGFRTRDTNRVDNPAPGRAPVAPGMAPAVR